MLFRFIYNYLVWKHTGMTPPKPMFVKKLTSILWRWRGKGLSNIFNPVLLPRIPAALQRCSFLRKNVIFCKSIMTRQLRSHHINNTLSEEPFLLAISDSMKVRLWITHKYGLQPEKWHGNGTFKLTFMTIYSSMFGKSCLSNKQTLLAQTR